MQEYEQREKQEEQARERKIEEKKTEREKERKRDSHEYHHTNVLFARLPTLLKQQNTVSSSYSHTALPLLLAPCRPSLTLPPNRLLLSRI